MIRSKFEVGRFAIGDMNEANDGRAGQFRRAASNCEAGFQLFNPMTPEAIGAETMNTLHEAYLNDTELIFSKLKQCVDRLVANTPRRSIDFDPQMILTRTIQLAVPNVTHAHQWLQLYMGKGLSIQLHARADPEYFLDLPPERAVIIPETRDDLAVGAALRLALERCE